MIKHHRAAIPVIDQQGFWGDAELMGEMTRHRSGNVLLVRGKASFLLETFEQDSEAQQVVVGFAVCYQITFDDLQGKVRLQFFIGPLSFHTNPYPFKQTVSEPALIAGLEQVR